MRLILLFTCIIWSFGLFAQVEVKERVKCKKKDIVFITGDKVPEGYTICGTADILRRGDHNNLNDLTEKEKKKIRSYTKMFKSCLVFVDFIGVSCIRDNNDDDAHEYSVFFYALRSNS